MNKSLKPLIGISSRVAPRADSSIPISGAPISYVETIVAAGGIPLLLPPGLSSEDLEELVRRCDGILLTGGEDVDPKLYNEEPHVKLGKVARERDESEITTVNLALAQGKPILAICRGLQLLNVALGGSLHQDIPSQLPDAHNHTTEKIASADWLELSHEVALKAGSRLIEILGKNSIAVNSLHHQSVKAVAPNLTINAMSRDGIIEGLESTDQPFLLGVQWHPEVLWQKMDREQLMLFKRFVSEAEKRRKIIQSMDVN